MNPYGNYAVSGLIDFGYADMWKVDASQLYLRDKVLESVYNLVKYTKYLTNTDI